MNPWLAYGLGALTPLFVYWILLGGELFFEYMRDTWINTVTWLPRREWKRFEWSDTGRALSITPKRWPHKGLVIILRPWRPKSTYKRPTMADDIHPIERDTIDSSAKSD